MTPNTCSYYWLIRMPNVGKIPWQRVQSSRRGSSPGQPKRVWITRATCTSNNCGTASALPTAVQGRTNSCSSSSTRGQRTLVQTGPVGAKGDPRPNRSRRPERVGVDPRGTAKGQLTGNTRFVSEFEAIISEERGLVLWHVNSLVRSVPCTAYTSVDAAFFFASFVSFASLINGHPVSTPNLESVLNLLSFLSPFQRKTDNKFRAITKLRFDSHLPPLMFGDDEI